MNAENTEAAPGRDKEPISESWAVQAMRRFPREFDPAVYRELHADLWYMDDEQLGRHYVAVGRREGRRAHSLAYREQVRDLVMTAPSVVELGSGGDWLFERSKRISSPDDFTNASTDGSTHGLVVDSHVLHRAPDLVAHLKRLEGMLEPNGICLLFVPDKRYCMNHFLPETTVGDVVAAMTERRTAYSLHTIVDTTMLTTHNDSAAHWRGEHGAVRHADVPALDSALRWHHGQHGRKAQFDVAAWYFSPDSFRTVFEVLRGGGLLGLELRRVYDTQVGHNEFWVVMQRSAAPCTAGQAAKDSLLANSADSADGLYEVLSGLAGSGIRPRACGSANQGDHIRLSAIDIDDRLISPRVPDVSDPRPLQRPEVFDATTLVYDIFRDDDGSRVHVLAPPSPIPIAGLQQLEFFDIVTSQRCEAEVRPGNQVSRIYRYVVGGVSKAGQLEVRCGRQSASRSVQPNESDRFVGRRVLVTMSKDNRLEWITDWARFHVHHFGVDAVLLYDNGSTSYSLDRLRTELSVIPGLAETVVIDWPFPFGTAVGARPARSWAKPAFLEHARRRFLARAAWVLNIDVDELLVQASSETLDHYLESIVPEASWISFPRYDVANFTPFLTGTPRHCHFWWRSVNDIGAPKYLARPERVPDTAVWWVHQIDGDAGMVRAESSQFYVANVLPLSVGWEGREKRLISDAIPGPDYSPDLVLRERLIDVDWLTRDATDTSKNGEDQIPPDDSSALVSDGDGGVVDSMGALVAAGELLPRELAGSARARLADRICGNIVRVSAPGYDSERLEADAPSEPASGKVFLSSQSDSAGPELLARMTGPEAALLAAASDGQRTVIEFGVGGSTLAMLRTSARRVVSVESDFGWIRRVLETAEAALASREGRLVIRHVDLGETKAWGYPTSEDRRAFWPTYWSSAWDEVDPSEVDLVFVDGRFRVACALNALLQGLDDVRILIHDYIPREHYHALEKHLDRVAAAETMVLFAPKRNMVRRAVQEDLSSFAYDPR